MAETLELFRTGPALSLIDGTDNIYLARNGWTPVVAEEDEDGVWPDSVYEVMTLHIDADDHDDLAAIELSINEYLRYARRYETNFPFSKEVWLRNQLTNETDDRRRLVKRGVFQVTGWHGPPTSPGNKMVAATLGLECMPFWEDPSGVFSTYNQIQDTTGVNVSIMGGSGSVPSRIGQFSIKGAGGGPLTEFWVGFRTDELGDAVDFQPVWQLEDAGTLSADTGEYVGGYIKCDFSNTTDWASRAQITLGEAVDSGKETDQRGTHLVLMRAKVDNSSNYARVRMRTGYSSGDDWRYNKRVKIASTDYYFYPLGTIKIPAILDSRYDTLTTIDIMAEAPTGTSELYMDRLVLVPQSEGSIHISNGYSYITASDTYETTVYRYANDKVFASTDYAPYRVAFDGENNWYLPLSMGGNVRMIIVAQRDSESVSTDKLTYLMTKYDRYTSLIGQKGGWP